MDRKMYLSKLPHKLPADLERVLRVNKRVKTIWDDITPLARNEFICWVISTKKSETRAKRIRRTCEELLEGKRRPCCWSGCTHR
ncbi:MAG: YdeI/OmpD-associated family protein [Minisyncoccia bacterium]